MHSAIIPVILSGGTGSRLWPLSREALPKQFVSLLGQKTLLQTTVERAKNIPGTAAPIVICNERHRFVVAGQLQAINIEPTAIILEPVGRNTAPAITIAALQALAVAEDPILLVLPSDHAILDEKVFCAIASTGVKYADHGNLLTFGIVPTHPETGYGYIKAGTKLEDDNFYAVNEFVEKPDHESATAYLEAGNYFWNSGMFMFRASIYIAEIIKHRPDIMDACNRAFAKRQQGEDFLHLSEPEFAACPSDSIDFAVMEKTNKAVVAALNAGWSDVGSWQALADISEADADGNIKYGDVIAEKSHNCYLRAESRFVAAIGVNDIVVVETPDAVLITDKKHSQDVKIVVDKLKADKKPIV